MSNTFKCIRCGRPARVFDIRKSDGLCDSCDSGPELAAAPAGGAEPVAWFDVNDRKPEKFQEVLIAFAGQCSIASTGQYTDSPHDHGGWCYPSENHGANDAGEGWPTVTHWRPLPEVPGAAAPTAQPQPKPDGQPLDPRQSIAVAQPEAPAEPSSAVLDAVNALIEAHGDTSIDFSGWCQRLSLRIEDLKEALATPAPAARQPAELTIRCPEKLKNGGSCPHHNLQCGWPACNEEK